MSVNDFFNKLEYQDSPLAALTEFLAAEDRFEQAQQTDKMRFVGYVLEIGYEQRPSSLPTPTRWLSAGFPADRS